MRWQYNLRVCGAHVNDLSQDDRRHIITTDDPPSRRDEVIDAQLRRAFEALTEQPLPDRFSDLIRKLRLEDAVPNPDPDACGDA